jgi:hypothetical protein
VNSCEAPSSRPARATNWGVTYPPHSLTIGRLERLSTGLSWGVRFAERIVFGVKKARRLARLGAANQCAPRGAERETAQVLGEGPGGLACTARSYGYSSIHFS